MSFCHVRTFFHLKKASRVNCYLLWPTDMFSYRAPPLAGSRQTFCSCQQETCFNQSVENAGMAFVKEANE